MTDGLKTQRLAGLAIDVSGRSDGDVLAWSAANKRIEFKTGGGGVGDMTEAEYNTLGVPGQVDQAAYAVGAGDADTVDGQHASDFEAAGAAAAAVGDHESAYDHTKLHSYKLQGGIPLYSHTNVLNSYQYRGTSYQANYRTGYGDECVAGITVDIDWLNTLFPGGWKFWIKISGSTTSATGLDTLSVRLVNDTGGTVGAGTVIGERTAALQAGSATKAWPLATSVAPAFQGIGPLDTGAVPTTGAVTITFQMRHTESGKTSYTGNWTLYAVAT